MPRRSRYVSGTRDRQGECTTVMENNTVILVVRSHGPRRFRNPPPAAPSRPLFLSRPIHCRSSFLGSPPTFLVVPYICIPLWLLLPFLVRPNLPRSCTIRGAYSDSNERALTRLQVLFSIYHLYLGQRISRISPSGQGDISEIQKAFKRLLKTGLAALPVDGGDEESMHTLRPGSPDETISQLEHDDPRAMDFRNCLRTWFRKATWSSIRLREVQKWIFWSIYNADMPPFEQLPTAQQTTINEALEQFKMRTGSDFPEGSNPQYSPMCLTVDPVKIHWRPLFFYILVAIVNRYLKGWFMDKYNIKHGSHEGLEYVLRPSCMRISIYATTDTSFGYLRIGMMLLVLALFYLFMAWAWACSNIIFSFVISWTLSQTVQCLCSFNPRLAKIYFILSSSNQ